MKEIIDLDFFLGLDESQGENGFDRAKAAARDREIYREIESGDHGAADVNDDTSLLLGWLDRRRQAFYRGSDQPRLPGDIYNSLYRWALRAMAVFGLVAGFLTAYSFLAYHGSRPVNVTLFIAFFILLQALLALATGIVLVRRIRFGGSNNTRYPFFHTLVFEMFMGKFRTLVEKAAHLPGGAALKDAGESELVSRFRSGTYKGLLFWPVFLASSLAGLCFSLGCLGGTLFRVMVTDLAFGWQSTLFTSGTQIHHMVSALALPWSWLVSDALPSLADVEGSRIILKQGIAGLATEHLAAWWPFLCMGILVYGIIPRLALATAGRRAGTIALDAFDLNRPRYRRLLMRMRSPRMDMEIRETGGTRAVSRPPLPDPARHPMVEPEPVKEPGPKAESAEPDISASEPKSASVKAPETIDAPIQEPEPVVAPQVGEESPIAPSQVRQNTPALILASPRSFPDGAMDEIADALDDQLGIDMDGLSRIGFDFEGDQSALDAVKPPEKGVVIILQEVWQPPIRGLLYYFTQLRREVFTDHDIWIFLTRTPGEGEMAVDADDMDFKVWQTAVDQLKDPGIIVERWMP